MEALYFGNLDVVRRLFAICPDLDCSLTTVEGQDVLDWLFTGVSDEQYATTDTVRQMLQLLTAQCKKLSCARVLVKTLSDPSLEDVPNTTPEQVRKCTLEIVNDALNCPDVNVNALDWKGNSPLMNAAFRGNIAVVNRLLEMKGIDVNYVNPQVTGRNALMEALISPEAEAEERRHIGWTTTAGIVALVSRLAPLTDLSHVDEHGNTAISMAVDLQKEAEHEPPFVDWINLDRNLHAEVFGNAQRLHAKLVQILYVARAKEIQKGLGLANVPGMPGGLREDISGLLAS